MRVKEVWIHIFVWLCLFAFPIAISLTQIGTIPKNFVPRMLLNPVLAYLNYLVLVPFFLLKKKVWQYVVLSLAVLVSFNYIANHLFFPTPPERLQQLIGSQNMEPFKNITYAMGGIVSFSFFLLGGLLRLTKDVYKREKMHSVKEVRRQETELQFLRAQLNPHFLFNSLNSIYSLVRDKSSEAPEAVITLAELMRYMIYEAKKELVPLSKEIDYIKNFVQLQVLRLSHSENVKLKITGDYNDKLIAPLLLIPFVENAFKYGTDFKGNTHVEILMKVVSDDLFFSINNKIGGYKRDQENSGIGLENIKNRLELLYPDQHSLLIRKKNGNYLVNLELHLS
ncbi:sensor histidine kinase [Flagellimonas allohymeniacidonis]|uniref:Sensor histidine kinase n=1 Tax=Flagellimonas allohymeniacidonis TaxID=2517819 RepID=A0A4Q8QA78_9FLAO|nr:histidine kinase [Allomuricauda hymeniacidonis]TAI47202.1 sensor histidine kinase [Allomuricauda hymeniacidonis]